MGEDMPPTYESATTTQQSSGIVCNPQYIRSIPGIIKIAEIVVSLITFICSIVHYWSGHGWVEFVALSAFVSALVYFIFTLLNVFSLFNRFSGPWQLIEFIYCVIFAVFFLVAALVAAALAANHYANVGATAFFAFVATAIFTFDAVYQYRALRLGDSSVRSQTTTTTTTSTVVIEHERSQY